jgi:predicted Zn-ribbon and HTH transcriptional regulator
MAQAKRFVCGTCRRAVEAWSDGNPYYIDESGCKQYAYHPDHERLARCIGNDSPNLCLDCGEEFKDDSRGPNAVCPKCGGDQFIPSYQLGGQRCPYCKAGVFADDPEFHCIS